MQRPVAALHEMLRDGREAVVLTEPQDEYPARPMSWLKAAMRRATGRTVAAGYHGFEGVGNSGYSLSARELERVSLGLGLR